MENTLILSRSDLGKCVGFTVWEQWPGDFILRVNDKEWLGSPPYVLGIKDAELIKISGVTAVKYPFTEKSPLLRKQATRIYLNHNGKGYLIEFVQTDKQGSYDHVFDRIISTLRFTE